MSGGEYFKDWITINKKSKSKLYIEKKTKKWHMLQSIPN